uniref:3Beta_HSD domain-containing protein n=1 Tax=Angiostrongylus cantonensis TaxID=6313 RepID=A0A0K0DJN6_ANGCA
LHEAQDLCLLPDEKQLQVHNVEFVQSLVSYIRCPLIHLSSVFVQCSSRWPNVYENEYDGTKYKSQWPFPKYCSSKWEAEQIIAKASVDAFIMRCVPAYGEGDTHSILTDLIKFTGNGDILSVGDGEGVVQMAYAGNLAAGLWSAVPKLVHDGDTLRPGIEMMLVEFSSLFSLSDIFLIIENKGFFSRRFFLGGTNVFPYTRDQSILTQKQFIKEIIILADETPKKNVFTLFKPLNSLFQLPHPTLGYFYFNHWTFFNTNKSRLLLHYVPKIDLQVDYCFTLYSQKEPAFWKISRFSEPENIKLTATYPAKHLRN